MSTTVHSLASCEGTLGAGTTVGPFTVVAKDARTGPDCVIGAHAVLEPGVVLGARVRVEASARVRAGAQIEDDVVIDAGAVVGALNGGGATRTLVRHGARVGANAVVNAGKVVGTGVVVGPGAVVTQDLPPNAIVEGNPARITGYVAASGPMQAKAGAPAVGQQPSAKVRGVSLITMPVFHDLRGDLAVMEFEKHFPFVPKRFFYVFNVPSEQARGEHAHRECHQLLMCLRGSIKVLVDDGDAREEVLLSSPSQALHMPPMTWGTQFGHTPDTLLAVFASHPYDNKDYIREYDEFLREAAQRKSGG